MLYTKLLAISGNANLIRYGCIIDHCRDRLGLGISTTGEHSVCTHGLMVRNIVCCESIRECVCLILFQGVENGVNTSLGNSMDTATRTMSNGLISKPNGSMSIMGDSVMEDSPSQTHLSPTHLLMDRGGSISISSSTTTSSSTSTTGLLGCNSMSMGSLSSESHLGSLESALARNNNNNNGLLMSSDNPLVQFGTKTSSSILMNNNNNNHGSIISSSLNSFPIEASTQTLQMDNTLFATNNNESTNTVTETQGNSAGNKLDEMCGVSGH